MNSFREVISSVVVLSTLAFGQQQDRPTPQDFYGFLMFQRALTQEISARRVGNSLSADGLERAALARYGISSEDFANLRTLTGPILDRLRAVDQQALAACGESPN